MQRMLIFLDYSTSSSAAFVIDGDFDRGISRGVAQFQLKIQLTTPGTRSQLCYDCSFQTARKRITAIPDTTVDIETIAAMADVAIRAVDSGEITFGDFDQAMFHLDALHRRIGLACEQLSSRYGDVVRTVVDWLRQEHGVTIEPSRILAIVRQETVGVVRPRFEQHKLFKANRDMSDRASPSFGFDL